HLSPTRRSSDLPSAELSAPVIGTVTYHLPPRDGFSFLSAASPPGAAWASAARPENAGPDRLTSWADPPRGPRPPCPRRCAPTPPGPGPERSAARRPNTRCCLRAHAAAKR